MLDFQHWSYPLFVSTLFYIFAVKMNGEAVMNVVKNETFCNYDNFVESNIYRKVLGTIIFILIWPFIVLDVKRFPLGRPAAALVGATLMVVFVVVPQDQVYHILGEKGNLQTLCLLVGMMMLSFYYDREGLLHVVALWILGEKKPFRYVLWKVCILSAVLSAIITNDATCLVITPLMLKEHIKQKRSPKEYPPLLIGIATSANIGSAATFFGNPQNAFIAANSNGQVSLLIFIIVALPAAVLGLTFSIGLLYVFHIRTICSNGRRAPILDATTDVLGGGDSIEQSNHEYIDITASRSDSDVHNETITEITTSMTKCDKGEVSLSYHRSVESNCTSPGQLAKERVKHFQYLATYPGSTSNSYSRTKCYPVESTVTPVHAEVYGNHHLSSSPEYGTTKKCTQLHLGNHLNSGRKSRLRGHSHNDTIHLLNDNSVLDSNSSSPPKSEDREVPSKWKKRVFCLWLIAATIILVVLLAIPPPPTVSAEFNLGLVPIGLSVFTIVLDTVINKKYAFEVMMKIDWTVILMFIGLFIWLGGFENTHFPSRAFELIRPYMDLHTVQGVFLFIGFIIIGSNILSNVPLVILIVDQLENLYCSHSGEKDDGMNYCSAQLVGVLLAWISTIAGNFTLIGSVANLIVAEKGRNVADYHLTFWEYFKFGLFSTAVVLMVGTPIVYFAGEHVHF